ncbi:unnamed protein product, partial [Aphanomyces euteiches]
KSRCNAGLPGRRALDHIGRCARSTILPRHRSGPKYHSTEDGRRTPERETKLE